MDKRVSNSDACRDMCSSWVKTRAEVPSDFFHQGTVGPLMPDFLYFLKKWIYFSFKKTEKSVSVLFCEWNLLGFFFFHFLKLEYNCFAMLCFCCTTKVNQLYVYIISPLSWISLLHHHPQGTPLGHHREQSWADCAIQQLPISYLNLFFKCSETKPNGTIRTHRCWITLGKKQKQSQPSRLLIPKWSNRKQDRDKEQRVNNLPKE